MKLNTTTTTLLATALLCAPAWAGDENKKKCDADASECISMMVENLSERGWIGIEWDDESEIPVLSHVVPGSPAEAAGLERGDVMLAFNGVATSEGQEVVWAEAKRALIPGNTIQLTIERAGVKKKVPVKLVALPRHVLALWVGNHVIDHHLAAKKESETEAETSRP